MIPGYEPTCGLRWTDDTDGPHGCILEPGHDGPHRCSCWREAP